MSVKAQLQRKSEGITGKYRYWAMEEKLP